MAQSLISSIFLGLLDQLQILSQLYLIELLGLLTHLGLLELQHLIYPRLLTGFGILVFFTNLTLVEFQVRYLALFLLFSVKAGFKWFWMVSLHKNMQLMLEFLKAPFFICVCGGKGVEPPTKFSKKGGGAWQDLNFQREVARKEGGDFFQGGGLQFFHIKNKLKSEIQWQKKFKQKHFSVS